MQPNGETDLNPLLEASLPEENERITKTLTIPNCVLFISTSVNQSGRGSVSFFGQIEHGDFLFHPYLFKNTSSSFKIHPPKGCKKDGIFRNIFRQTGSSFKNQDRTLGEEEKGDNQMYYYK